MSASSRADRIWRRCANNGLTLKSEGETVTVRLPCTDKADEAGPQDYVIVTLKANGLAPAAPQIAKLMGPRHRAGHRHQWRSLLVFLRPGRTLARPRDRKRRSRRQACGHLLPPRQAIGCIVYPAAEVIEPGVIEHTYGNRFTLGEPDGSKSARVEALSQMLVKAGLKAPVRTNIRDEIWVKLWGNLAFNPLSALTGFDAGSARLPARPARRGARHDGGSAGGGRGAGREIRRQHRQAHRRRRRSRRAQDLHAAGPGARPPDGDRCAAGRGGGAGGTDRKTHAAVPTPSWPWCASAPARRAVIRKDSGT